MSCTLFMLRHIMRLGSETASHSKRSFPETAQYTLNPNKGVSDYVR